ncbi:hypothetical protein RJT34_14494 [Clitoria ternatea]|uniref:Uncharacterized protein n=1 Tax=Clitoria ternatea TaxID=43366 RepID=A0AAN9JSQ4_CLITE
MAQKIVQVLVPLFLLVLVVGAGATPPGIAKNPSHASCKIKKYKHCYNLVHVCPKFCPDECTVECASCKPICVGSANPPPDTPTPSTPPIPPPTPENPPPSSSPPTPTPENPPPTSSIPPSSTPLNPPPTPSPIIPSPSTPPNTNPPSPTPPSTPTPSSTPPNTTPPSTPPSTPSPSPSTPPSTKPSPTPPSPSTPSPKTPSPRTARCKDKNYPSCYFTEHVCPSACPTGCEVDCKTCKPVCTCDRPGAVCQDPRFIGGDGNTFYFHGKKDSNFCLVSDPNLHINAHFIGRRNQNMKRDFTWVQSIAILFDNHQLFVGANKTSTWQHYIDHLVLTFDNQPITLH